MASRCQRVTCGFHTCALELAYAVKYNNLCERWESCQKKKSKCSLLSSAPDLHMALGFQKSKIIYTGEPSLKNMSEHWLKWALWHWATLRPTNRQLPGAATAWVLLSSVKNKALRGLKWPQPGVWLAELASLVPSFLLTAWSPWQPPSLLSSSLPSQQSGTICLCPLAPLLNYCLISVPCRPGWL